jgi:acetylornithine deacetylase
MAAAPPDDAAVLAAVAAGAAEMEALLEDLVRERTLLGAEMPGQDVMRAAFAGLGLDPVDVPLDPEALRASPAASPFSWDVAGKASVTARWGGAGDGRSLILNGHVDVVSPEPAGLWSSDPFEPRREGEWMYGRGAGDMKAGLAAIVGAVAALQRLGHEPAGAVELQSVVEEECTGNGAAACVLAGSRADAAVITEPTGGAIWNAQVGVLWFSVRVAGRPAHAGEAASGHNAIEAMVPVIAALRALEADLNVAPPAPFADHQHPINLNVGTIRGGDWPSTVAGECVAEMRLALYPSGDVASLRERVETTVAEAAAADAFLQRCTVEVRYDGFACEGYVLESDPVIGAVGEAAARVHGVVPGTFASTATTDARTFHLHGATPAICFGPYADNIHSVDERVHLPSMVQTAQVLALLIRDWCG